MTDKFLKEIREKISCPQFGDDHYGEWGILNVNQRRTIKRLIDYMDGQEAYIKNQQAEIERLEKEFSTATNHITRLENQIERLLPMLKTKRTEAIKEFAERLKNIYVKDKRYDRPNAHTLIDWLFANIDNLVKEMVGEDK